MATPPAAASKSPTKKPWQFSLRTLLIAALVIAVLAGKLGYEIRAQRPRRAAMISLEQQNANVNYRDNDKNWRRILGPLYVPPVHSVGFHLSRNSGQTIDLSPLVDLPELEELTLHNATVADLEPLARCAGLKRLTLRNSRVAALPTQAAPATLDQLSQESTVIPDYFLWVNAPRNCLMQRFGVGPLEVSFAEGEYSAYLPLQNPELERQAIAAIVAAIKVDAQNAMYLGDDFATLFENPPRPRDWWALALADMTGLELHISPEDLPVARDEKIDVLLGEAEQSLQE